MDANEGKWDKLLKIRTTGRDDSRSDQYRYPYEPTPYCVLERLANSGYITKKNTLVDYGCGKGRVDFYLSWQTRCKSIGIEYDERIFREAVKNRESAVSGERTIFECQRAEDYVLPSDADRFYFFNPFSVELFRKVLGRIRGSYYENPRELLLFFYYPSDEYVSFLMTEEELDFCDEIDCRDLFSGDDHRENILIFSMGNLSDCLAYDSLELGCVPDKEEKHAFTYQKATIKDIDMLTETRIQVLRAANKLSDTVDMEEVRKQTYEYYQSALVQDAHVAYLVFDGDLFIGAGGVSFYQVMPTYHNPSGKKAYIMNMYTAPLYRRRHIAYHTLDLLVSEAKRRGIQNISLEATGMGRPLYERYGFVKMKDEMELPVCDGSGGCPL